MVHIFKVYPLLLKIRWENGTPIYNRTLLELGSWQSNDIQKFDQAISNRIDLENYLCLRTDDYYLMSDFNGNKSSNVYFAIEKCQNSTSNVTCKSDTEIDRVLSISNIHILTVSAYFDSDDYKSPIKTYSDDFEQFGLSTLFGQTYEIKVRQNKAILTDDYFAAISTETHNFYSLETPITRINRSGNQFLLEIYIRLSKESEQHERVVYSFFDLFGYIGGLFDFLYFVGYFLIEYF